MYACNACGSVYECIVYETVVCTNDVAPQKHMSLLQNIVFFIGLFCKRDLSFYGAY